MNRWTKRLLGAAAAITLTFAAVKESVARDVVIIITGYETVLERCGFGAPAPTQQGLLVQAPRISASTYCFRLLHDQGGTRLPACQMYIPVQFNEEERLQAVEQMTEDCFALPETEGFR